MKTIIFKIEDCLLCNGTGEVQKQIGFNYKNVKCNHKWDYEGFLHTKDVYEKKYNKAFLEIKKYWNAEKTAIIE